MKYIGYHGCYHWDQDNIQSIPTPSEGPQPQRRLTSQRATDKFTTDYGIDSHDNCGDGDEKTDDDTVNDIIE